jgi:flagellar motility protein MotE (MotC chaperone)
MIRLANKTKRVRNRSGALFAIAVLLLGSATLRLILEAGPAIANEMSKATADLADQARSTVQPNPSHQELRNLMKLLRAKEEKLKLREVEFEDRMKTLEVADRAIAKRLEELVTAEQQLRETLAMADGASEEDLDRLTSIYEKLKPKDSAALFQEMDPQFAAGFLARMRPEVAAGILSGLSPQAAYSISVVLAGRNAMVPTN